MSLSGQGKVAIITGASSGIGKESARALAKAGFEVALGARRSAKLEEVREEIWRETGIEPFTYDVDVTVSESCDRFIQAVYEHYGKIHVLVNNAGLALGSEAIADAEDESEWETVFDTNIMGVLRMTRRLIPIILESGGGHIINLGSIAGRVAYAGGAAYCASKFAVRAITEALREELLGKPIRITTVDPGMVETDFSVVRYRGDEARAKAVYEGMTPLTAEDIADCVVFAATRPAHVNIDAIIIKPLDQAGAGKVARRL